MFRPQIQKTKILIMMALVNVILVLFISNSKTYLKQSNYESKVKAVDKMLEYIDFIKHHTDMNISSNDFYETGLVGQYETSITSIVDSSFLNSKIITSHPNFAAFTLSKLKELSLIEGDHIAVSMTGSFPGANLALLAACDIMKLKPIIISSLGSSSYGANRENWTWLDFENLLFKDGFIKNRSKAVSIGGGEDIGNNIGPEGFEVLEDKIFASGIEYINKENLEKSINTRWNLYYKEDIDYKAFINIGGGAASLGGGAGKNDMIPGITTPLAREQFDDIFNESADADIYYNSFKKSLAYKFLDKGVPFLNIKEITKLIGLGENGLSDKKLNISKKGSLFYEIEEFNIRTIWVALLVSLSLSIIIGAYSHIQIKRRMVEDEIDSVI